MLKNAFDHGVKAALEKFALAPSMMQSITGALMRHPQLATAGAGALIGGLSGGDLQSAALGGLAGYGVGHIPVGGGRSVGGAMQHGLMGDAAGPGMLGAKARSYGNRAMAATVPNSGVTAAPPRMHDTLDIG